VVQRGTIAAGWSVLELSLIDQRISMQSVLFATRRSACGRQLAPESVAFPHSKLGKSL
jgi:hypothetical protein